MGDFITEFQNNMLGDLTIAGYASGMIMALVGAILMLRINAKKRDISSESTPYKFSWSFLVQDNLQRLITGFLLTYAAFRFAPQILQNDFSMFTAFLTGACFDQVAKLISKLQLKARE